MPKISRLRLKILQYLIEKGTNYNEAMAKDMQEDTTTVWRMLGRMENDELILAYIPEKTNPSDRRNLVFYKITNAGKKYFDDFSDYLEEFTDEPKKHERRGI